MSPHWPQYTILFLFALKVVLSGLLQGKKTEVTYNPWSTLIGGCVTIAILYYGGFFAPIGFGAAP